MADRDRGGAAAWLFSLIAAVCFAAMWLGYRQGWGWLAAVDAAGLRVGHDIGVKHPGWVWFWDAVCTVFAPVTFRVLGIAAVVVALVQRRVRTGLLVLVSVEFSGLISQAVKNLTDRPRPVTALVAAHSSSFPSGHAVGVTVGVAALLTVAWPVLRGRARPAAVAVGALIVAGVGIGRVALNVHHPSDVLAGWALGYLYFAACAALIGAKPGGSASLDGGEAKLGPPHEPSGSASLDGGEAKLGPPHEPSGSASLDGGEAKLGPPHEPDRIGVWRRSRRFG